jgi:hypothetical protein
MCPGVCVWEEREGLRHLIYENPVEYSICLLHSQMNCVYIDDLVRCILCAGIRTLRPDPRSPWIWNISGLKRNATFHQWHAFCCSQVLFKLVVVVESRINCQAVYIVK